MIQVIIDLRNQFGPGRDQGHRPTCMAFAASDAHSAARKALDPLSTEFAYFHAVRRSVPPDPGLGVSFERMADAIHHDGQPHELQWPYLQALPADMSAWSPPSGCAPIFRREFLLEAGSLDRVLAHLDASVPVVITMRVSPSFYLPDSDGVIAAGPTEPAVNSHAVVAVGRGRRSKDELVLIRNSWGEQWGLHGHAWLTDEYLRPRLMSIGTANSKEV
jgi:Papain family cysteine protease